MVCKVMLLRNISNSSLLLCIVEVHAKHIQMYLSISMTNGIHDWLQC